MMSVIILFLFVGALIAVPVVLLSRRRSSGSGGSPAEFLVYLIMVVATLLTTNAFSSLIEIVVPGEDIIVGGSDDLALSLATLLVSGVVAFLLWRRMETQTVTGDRPARALYVSVVAGFSMAVVAGSIARLLLWVVGQNRLPGVALADLVAFGAVWWLHERIRRRGSSLDVVRSLAGSLVGLVLSAVGLSAVLRHSLTAVFESGTVVAGSGVWDGVILGLVLMAVGVPYLWWFWMRDVARLASPWREGYAGIVAIVAWFTGVGALAGLLYSLLIRWAGIEPGFRPGSPFPLQIALVVSAGLAYWHHREVLGPTRTPSVRVLAYLFSTAAFVVGAGGLVTLAASLISNLTEGSVAGTGIRTVLGALVAVVVAATALWRYWLPGQRLASEPAEERATARRLAIVGLLTASALTAVGGLIAVLYALLRAALGSDADLGDILTWSVPLTMVTGLLAWYFARIRPQRVTPTGVPGLRVSTVTLVASDPGPLPGMIDRVRFLRRTDGVGVVSVEQAEAIVAALAQVETPAAIVVVGADSFEIVPLA